MSLALARPLRTSFLLLPLSGLTFFFLVGAILPIAAFIIGRKWPNSLVKYVNFPILFNGTTYIPPASAYNYVPWVIVGFIFNYVIRRRHFSWWTKYNCGSRSLCSSSRILNGIFL